MANILLASTGHQKHVKTNTHILPHKCKRLRRVCTSEQFLIVHVCSDILPKNNWKPLLTISQFSKKITNITNKLDCLLTVRPTNHRHVVTWQIWRSCHCHSICHIQKPYANFTALCVIEEELLQMEFLYYEEAELLSTAILHCGNEDFGCFVLLWPSP